MSAIDIASAACLAAGAFFCLVGALGMLRMPDFYTRVHAASVVDTLGAGFVLFGLLLQAGFTLVGAKLVMLGLMLFFASPTATHALVRAAQMRGVRPLLAPECDAPVAADARGPGGTPSKP
jgi:multicomponent Na+:H+ antiporter subunit G